MSRYLGPKLKITRRLGNLPGLTRKQSKKDSRPGQHGRKYKEENKKPTEYGVRLEEKQKLKFNYGLTESRLYLYVKEARRRKGITGLILLQLLAMRLDSLCFILGFAPTISSARQLVNHGHITINGEVITIPSFQCRLKDRIGIKPKKSSNDLITKNIENKRFTELPNYLKFDKLKLEAEIINYYDCDNLFLELNELLVVKYYSRR